MGFQELIDQYKAGNVSGEQPLPALKGGYLDSGTPAPAPTPQPPTGTKPVPTISAAPSGAMEKAQSADIRSPNSLGEMFASFVNNLEDAKKDVVNAAVNSKPAQQVGLLGQAAKTAYSTLPKPVQAAGNLVGQGVGQGVGLLGDALSYQHPGYENAIGGPGILEAITPMAGKAGAAAKAVGSIANLNRAKAVSVARDIAVKSGARNLSGVQHIEKYFTSVGDDVTANAMRMLQEDMAAGKVSLATTEAATAKAATSLGGPPPAPPITEPPLSPVKGAEAFVGEAKPAFDALSMGDDVVNGTAFAPIPRSSRAGIYNATMKEIKGGTKVVLGGQEFVAKAEGTQGSIRFVDMSGKAVDNATNIKLVGAAGSDFASTAGRNPGETIYKVSFKTDTGGDSHMWTTWNEANDLVRTGRGKLAKSVRVPPAPTPTGAGTGASTATGGQRAQGTIESARPVTPPAPEAVAAEAAAQNAPLGLSRAKEWFDSRSGLQKGLLGTAGAGAGAAAMSPLADDLSGIGADARLRSKDPGLTPVQQLLIGGFGNVASGVGAVSSLAGSGASTIYDLFTKPAGEIQEALQKNPELAEQLQKETGLDIKSEEFAKTSGTLAEQGADTPEGQAEAMDVAVSDLTNMVVDGKDEDEIDKYMGNTFVGTLSKLIFGDTKKWWLFMALGMGIGAAAGANGKRDVIDRIMGAFYAAPMVGLKEIRSAQKEPTGKMYIITDLKGNSKIVRDSNLSKMFKNGIIPNDIKIRSLDGSGASSSNLLTERGKVATQMAGAINVSESRLKTLQEQFNEVVMNPTLVDPAFLKQTRDPNAIIAHLIERGQADPASGALEAAERLKSVWLPEYRAEQVRNERLHRQYQQLPSFQ